METRPAHFNRHVRTSQEERDGQGELEGRVVTLECGHRYWLGADTTDGVPETVWCHFCEAHAANR